MERIFEFLKDCQTMYVASVENDCPRVRPFSSHMSYKGRMYLCCGDYKESYRQLKANPNIEICACNPEGRFIRIRGIAVFDESEEAVNAFYAHEPGLKAIYKDVGLRLATFYIDKGYAELQGGPEPFERFCF